MTTKNPEIPQTPSPDIQAFFDQRNAGYVAIADNAVKKVVDAKAAAQTDDTKLLTGAPGGAAGQTIENDPTQAPTPRPRRQRVRPVTPAPTSAPTQEPTLADAGLNGRAEVVRFGDLNREELFKEFQSFDFTDKVKLLQAANKALRTAMDSVVRLHGFKDVKAAVRDLDGKSLIFKKTREGLEQALGGAWQAKQFKGIDPDKLFLEYHDVLVAAEEVLDNLRLQHLDRAPEDLSRPDTLPIEKLEEKFPGLLDQIRAKAKEWEDVCGSIEDQQVKSFIQAVRERLQLVGVPHVKRIADELTSMNPDHGWRGEKARKDMLRAIRFHGTLEQLVEAARSLSKQFPQKEPVAAKAGVEPSAVAASSAVDLETELARQWRGWRGKPLEKVGAVERAYQRWLELDQQIRQFHDENRLRADLESSGLKEDKVGKILLLAEDNEAKAAKLQSIREDVEAGKELDDKEAGFLTANFHGYGQLIAAAERIVKEREAEPVVAASSTPVAAPAAAPAVPAATSDVTVPIKSAKPASREPSGPASGDAAVTKRLGFLENLRSRFRDRYNAASLRLDEVERSAKDDRQYRALRETLASIQADFQLISDPVTLQRYAAGEMEVASGSTKVSDGYLDIVDQLKTLTERVELVGRSLGETAAEKESKREVEAEFRERLERVKDLITMGAGIRQYVGTRWEKQLLPELQKRAPGQYRYYNIAGIQKWLEQEEEIHQWHGDKAVQAKRRLIDETLPILEEMVGHMRDIATEMRAAGEISQTKDDKAISPDKVREVRLARERFEREMGEAVMEFANGLDESLRQKGKDVDYRLSAVLSHLQKAVNTIADQLKGDLVLSPAEKKAMLKAFTAQVIDSRGE